MKKVGIYLAGTIYNDEPDKSWKTKLQCQLDDTMYSFFDPAPVEHPSLTVVPRDKSEIQKCDILVAYMQKATVGTSMEILFASMLGTKPILIINPNGEMIGNIWLEAHAHEIFSSIENCVESIKNMKF